MDEIVAEQLLSIRDAILEAMSNSERVMQAIDLLKQSGRDVQIVIDAMLVDEEKQEHESLSGQNDQSRGVLFDTADQVFLHKLNISCSCE